MTYFVLDCSVATSWFIDDESNVKSYKILDMLVDKGAIVPCIWSLEVASSLLKGERNKRITKQQRMAAFHTLNSLNISVDNYTHDNAWLETLELAYMHNLSPYDASYLELALRKNKPIATFDKKLKSAAKILNIEIIFDN